MFGLWRKIDEKGSVAIPTRNEALSRLEWVEVSEYYPELVPPEYRGCDIYSEAELLMSCPFVRVGNAYKFRATKLDLFVNMRELVDVLCAKDYIVDGGGFLGSGVLTCSCGIPDCDGIDSESFHVSEWMVRWDVCRYGREYTMFFERESYDCGVVRMLYDLCRPDGGIDYKVGGGYETSTGIVEGVSAMLARHPYYADIWAELGFKRLKNSENQGDGYYV